MKPEITTRTRRSILLVEDELETLELLTSVATRRFPNIVIHTAMNARKALELFRTFLPEIVITDINMPDMCGAQMAAKIRAIEPRTKVIVITGDTGKLALETIDGGGIEVDCYMAKPVRLKDLFAAIEQCSIRNYTRPETG
jgi:YesN/AraC family two-component response regulator